MRHGERAADALPITLEDGPKSMRHTGPYDVYGLGNAIVDTEVQVDDAFLTAQGLTKGVMTLVTEGEQSRLRAALGGHAQLAAAGGSAANTMVGVALFGGHAFYTGKVGNDMAGALYRESMAEAGVEFDVEAAERYPTGTCLVLVTPDGERTMQTNLGSSGELGPDDVDDERLARSRTLYVEGYLWASPEPAAAARRALEEARYSGISVALSFSDPSIVSLFANELRTAARDFSEVVFCNEHEAMLYAGTSERQAALEGVAADCPVVFMTCGKDGSLIWDHGRITHVGGYTVPVVDTTGAGDIYAAGVLFGLSRHMAPSQAAMLGSFASAKVVTELGPRLRLPLNDRIDDILGGAHPLDW